MAISNSIPAGKRVPDEKPKFKTGADSASKLKGIAQLTAKDNAEAIGKPPQAETTTKNKLESSDEPKKHATATRIIDNFATMLETKQRTLSQPKADSTKSPKPVGQDVEIQEYEMDVSDFESW